MDIVWVSVFVAAAENNRKKTQEKQKKIVLPNQPPHTLHLFPKSFLPECRKSQHLKFIEKKEKYTKYIVLNGCCLMFYIFLLLL